MIKGAPYVGMWADIHNNYFVLEAVQIVCDIVG